MYKSLVGYTNRSREFGTVDLDLEFFLCAPAREECRAREERGGPRMDEIGLLSERLAFCKAVCGSGDGVNAG
jgi:hypothetical protein